MRLALVVATAVLSSCTRGAAPVPDAGTATARAPGEREVSPVYAQTAKSEPLAVRTCRALHGLRAERRAACCGGAAGPSLSETECVKTLSQSLQTHAVSIAPDALERCEHAQAGAFEGCDWPGPDDSQPAEACLTLIDGALGVDAVCRSSLECARGLHCLGGGPTDVGKCSAPGRPQSLCALSVDPLAAYTAQRLDDLHPECEGACERRRCVAAFDAGVACFTSLQCGSLRHCSGDAGCVDGAFAGQGEPCVAGGCGGALRCIDSRCAPAKAKGERCAFDSQCVGACDRDAGVCGPRCR